MTERDRIFYWQLASAAAIALGAFGPWAKVAFASVSGVDGGNDGWFDLVIAGAAAASILRGTTRLLPVVLGIAATAIAFYDRRHVERFGVGLVQVGWGLNLVLAGGASLAVASWIAWRRRDEPEGG